MAKLTTPKPALPQGRPEPAAHDASQRAARAAAEAASAELGVLGATERTKKAVKTSMAADAELAAARTAEREKRLQWTTAAARAVKRSITAARAAQLAAQCLVPPPGEAAPPKNGGQWEPLELLNSVPAALA